MRNYRFSPCDFQCVGCLKTERWKAWACLWKRHQWTRKRIFSLFNMPSLFIFGSKFILPPIYDDFSLNFPSLTHTHTHKEGQKSPTVAKFYPPKHACKIVQNSWDETLTKSNHVFAQFASIFVASPHNSSILRPQWDGAKRRKETFLSNKNETQIRNPWNYDS